MSGFVNVIAGKYCGPDKNGKEPRFAHDYACVDHAGQSQKWAIVTKSSEAVRW